jgi:acyl carrier protein
MSDVSFLRDRVSVKDISRIYAEAARGMLARIAAKARRGVTARFLECGMQNVAEIRTRIVALVQGILEQNSIAAEVTADAKLVDIGLTSVDMVNLMLGVEAEFDFTIPQDEITPENFRSVATLERMVARELRTAQAA